MPHNLASLKLARCGCSRTCSSQVVRISFTNCMSILQVEKAAPRRPTVQVVRKKPAAGSAAAAASAEPPAKRQHTGGGEAGAQAVSEAEQASQEIGSGEAVAGGDDADGGGLAGLLGGYDSDSV